jgi:predicted outer membrane repeat protein
MKKIFLHVSLCLIFLMVAHTSWAKIFYVKAEGSDTNTGSSWDQAFWSIHRAVESSSDGDEIWVAKGTYVIADYIWVNKKVGIYGGFIGSENNRSLRKWWENRTAVHGGNETLCFDVSADAVIDGFLIVSCSGDYGGAVMIVTPSGAPRTMAYINNSIFSGNVATNAGGAIYVESATSVITNSIFFGNSSTYYGGAIMNYEGNIDIVNSTFSRNESYYGGAIYDSYSGSTFYEHLRILNSILWGDAATNGGEIYRGGSTGILVAYTDIQQSEWVSPGQALNFGNINQDPLFENPTTGDFHLKDDSPCIDKGTKRAFNLPVTDFEGDQRITGFLPDMGADESEVVLNAVVWYVDGDVVSSGTGRSWGTAFKTIQEAISAAENYDEVWVKGGTYTLSVADILVDKHLFIYGGFGGAEQLVSQRDWGANVTTVDGGNYSGACIWIEADATIDGFAIRNCAPGILFWGRYYPFPCGKAAITHSTFYKNTQAIANNGCSDLTVSNSVFWDNHITAGSGQDYGGAIWSYNAELKVINSSFYGNTASDSGGAIYSELGQVRLTNSILWGDTYSNVKEIGNYYATVTALNSNIDQEGFSGSNGNIRQDPHYVDSSNGDLRLQHGSPCEDAGNNEILQPDDKDLDGNPRSVDGDDNGIAIVDMGAYEYQRLMQEPNSQRTFISPPTSSPVISGNPVQTVPIAVGSVAVGGDTLSLKAAFPQCTGPVDIYLAVSSPELDPYNLYMILPDLSLQPLSSVGLVPWKANTLGPINASLYGDLPVSALPGGTYYLYMAVTPVDNFGSYYLWTTHFENKTGQSPVVSNLVVPSSICANELFRIKYNYNDPDGLGDVKEHHILMSDGYHGLHPAGGTGIFDVGGFYFSDPGTHWVKVYVVDFEGHQSNVLEVYLSVQSCN